MMDRIWVTRDGQWIPVGQMSTSHIQNCITLIHRKNGWRREYLDRLLLELLIREMTE